VREGDGEAKDVFFHHLTLLLLLPLLRLRFNMLDSSFAVPTLNTDTLCVRVLARQNHCGVASLETYTLLLLLLLFQ
jgi:hypothetical protein